ncbi:MAG: amino acid amidase [Tissierellia bacterium]|nr:amino acid amidase [Tissierellia bacterium]
MKIYISADIEGVTGVTHWDETIESKPDYKEFAHQMTLEVKAACEGAIAAGADEIWVNDAHNSGRNIDHNLLPKNTKLIRGWSGHILFMVQELDESFDAAMFIGYHAASGTDASPLAHSMDTEIDYMKLNGEHVTEFLVHTYISNYLGVPVVFVSGDLGVCDSVKEINSNIVTIPVKEGIGDSTVNIHPQLALDLIRSGVENSLKGNLYLCDITLPEDFILEIKYGDHCRAYKKSFYPGAKRIGADVVEFKSSDYMDVLRAMAFLL